MSDLAPTMSGANEERKPDAVEDTVDKQSEAQPKSIPSLASSSIKPSETEHTAAAASPEASAAVSSGADIQDKEGTAKGEEPTTTQATDAAPSAATVESTTEPSTEASQATPAAAAAAVTPRGRADSLSIEQQTDDLAGGSSSPTEGHLVCNITLLLPTGARHPYRIDEKYLTKRNVEVPDVTESGQADPFSISVYKLKELILREWRDEWEAKPASPSSIRLIHFGKLLDDKEQLKKYHFSAEAPNVVHMSVRPPEMMEEDEAAKGKNGGRETRSREGGGGCCVIL